MNKRTRNKVHKQMCIRITLERYRRIVGKEPDKETKKRLIRAVSAELWEDRHRPDQLSQIWLQDYYKEM